MNLHVLPGNFATFNSHVKSVLMQAQNLARILLSNSQDLGFPFLSVKDTQRETEKALPEILFHVTAVLRCIDFDELLEPLRTIALAPSHMLVSRNTCMLNVTAKFGGNFCEWQRRSAPFISYNVRY